MQRHATLGHISPSLFPCSLAFRVAVHSRFTTFRVIMSHFFSSAFRATSPVVGIQSHHHFLVAAFRAITASQFRRSEPSSVLRSTFRVTSSVSAFRVIITSQFDVQSHHHHFLVSASRAITVILFRLPESLSSSCLGFQSHYRHLV